MSQSRTEVDAIIAKMAGLVSVIGRKSIAARIVAEPGGAATLSALLSGAYRPNAGERVGMAVSGGISAAVDFDR